MRVRLDHGQRLDLNRLIRDRVFDPIGAAGLYVVTPAGRQRIEITSRPRRFGGCQLYFVCPVTRRLASVLWMPRWATQFASRHAWRSLAAYSSQFERPHDRAYRAQRKISARLLGAPVGDGHARTRKKRCEK